MKLETQSLRSKCLNIISRIEKLDQVMDISSFREELGYIKDRLNDSEFRIAVVGEFSSGKSTFINAVIGQDLLIHGTTETTATITRIVNVERNDPRWHTVEAFFRDGTRKQIPFDRTGIQKYTTTNKSICDVAKEIEAVEIYMDVLHAKHNIVLVDTPGLNGTADRHREQTVRLIQQAHACIYLIQNRGLSDSDILFLQYLTQIQKRFIFIQNFIDEFNAAEGENPEEHLRKQKDILDQRIFLPEVNAQYDICGISALLELVSVDHSIRRLYDTDSVDLSLKDREQCHNESGFEGFRTLLEKTFCDENIDKIQYEDTAKTLVQWLDHCLEILRNKENNAQKIYQMSRSGSSIRQLDLLKKRIEENRNRQQEKLENLVESECGVIRQDGARLAEQKLEQAEQEFSAKITAFKKIDPLEQWVKDMPGQLKATIGRSQQYIIQQLTFRMQSLYQILLQRIEEYSGFETKKLNMKDIKLTPEVAEIEQLQENSVISELEGKITELQQSTEKNQRELKQYEQSVRMKKAAVLRLETQQEKRKQGQEDALSKLGCRPKAKETVKYVNVPVARTGLFVGLRDALFGEKTELQATTYMDDSRGQEWDRKRAEYKNNYTAEIAVMNLQLRNAERELTRFQNRVQDSSDKVAQDREKLERLEKRLVSEKAVFRDKKEKAAREYLNGYKAEVQKQIHEYLMDDESGVLPRICEQQRTGIESVCIEFKKRAVDIFNQSIEQRLRWLDQARAEQCPELLTQVNDLAQNGQIIEKLRDDLRGILA